MKDTENRRICKALAATSLVPSEAAFDWAPDAAAKARKIRNVLKRIRKNRR